MKEEVKVLANYVVMSDDYATDSFNLGNRTYQKGHTYKVDNHILAEIVGAGAGEKLKTEWAMTSAPLRRMDEIVPSVTRWFTANGHDTHHLTKGERTNVPSNLAVWLTMNGYAEAA
ncbi:MAG: hypothetical protein K8U57_27385 [Planctomycetes bacterium]|nr:hypothetical protein [Planctomycetota bacterium]